MFYSFILLKFKLFFKSCISLLSILLFYILGSSVAIFGCWMWRSLSPALLAHGHWHRTRFPGSHGLGLDGEELGSGKNPSWGAGWEVRVWKHWYIHTKITSKHSCTHSDTHTLTHMLPLFKHTLLSLKCFTRKCACMWLQASVPPLLVLMG